MADSETSLKKAKVEDTANFHFDVSTGLKRVLGRELITNDEVAIFEMVKNSFDAGADTVQLYFGEDNVIVADNGSGMSYQDLNEKWLFVAYSSKRDQVSGRDFRDRVAERNYYAGSKGIGRFSSDRLGEELILQTRPKGPSTVVHRLVIDWDRFEHNDQEHFEQVPVQYTRTDAFQLPKELRNFVSKLNHGTAIEIQKLRRKWDRPSLLALKSSLAKLINPFGAEVDRFSIHINAPAELPEDRQVKARSAKAGEDHPLAKDLVNGRVGNFIFSALQEKTTFIRVSIDNSRIHTTLIDRGELIYRIEESNPYRRLDNSGFRCDMYYLNHAAKLTFARRVGLPFVQFGSVFLFRNGFRVYPIGEDDDDWFGFNRRKQQGYNRFLGTREIIGRVDVFGSDEDFQEASSRNQGLIDTPAVRQLQKAVLDHCLKRLEKYVVPVSWVDKGDADSEDLSRLLTDPGRARVSAAIANLVDNEDVKLLEYSKRLVGLLNERSSEFESSLVSLRSIAEKTGDKKLLAKLETAEKRFDELRRSESEARKVADRALAASVAAVQRAEAAEEATEHERRRSHFLASVISLDTSTILNLHHQVAIYAVDVAQQIENFLAETSGQKTVARETVLQTLEHMAFLNQRIYAITRFAAQAKFKLESEKIDADIASFIAEYIENIARVSGSARMRVEVKNGHPGLRLRFKPIDISIIVDNLISNARRAKASTIRFELEPLDKTGLLIHVTDNGHGLARGADPERIFEMGYTTTHGSGLGLYHIRQVLGEMGGSIEFVGSPAREGTEFIIKVVAGKKSK